jgi:hypothetical protein
MPDQDHATSALSFRIESEFLRLPKLEADGRNWVTYKDRLMITLELRGLQGHVTGATTKPTEEGRAMQRWLTEQSIIKFQYASTIADSLYLDIKGKTVKEGFDKLVALFEKRSMMNAIELKRKLATTFCEENADVREHFRTMKMMREDLAVMGEAITDAEFASFLVVSLPKSFDAHLSAVSAVLRADSRSFTAEQVEACILDEYDRQLARGSTRRGKGARDVALTADGQGRKKKSNIECHNCGKKGHKKADCWAKGGGKEG